MSCLHSYFIPAKSKLFVFEFESILSFFYFNYYKVLWLLPSLITKVWGRISISCLCFLFALLLASNGYNLKTVSFIFGGGKSSGSRQGKMKFTRTLVSFCTFPGESVKHIFSEILFVH